MNCIDPMWIEMFADILASGKLASQFLWRNVMNAGVVLKSTGIGCSRKSLWQIPKTSSPSWSSQLRLESRITATQNLRRCQLALNTYILLTTTARPFGLLSDYAALNMSPMTRAPEVTAPGKLCHPFKFCFAAHTLH